jgi:hypothetical protein
MNHVPVEKLQIKINTHFSQAEMGTPQFFNGSLAEILSSQSNKNGAFPAAIHIHPIGG